MTDPVDVVETPRARLVGLPVPRKEDARPIAGQTRWTDNLTLPGLLHLAVLRSPMAHARITGIDASAALEYPGVVGGGPRAAQAAADGAVAPAWGGILFFGFCTAH